MTKRNDTPGTPIELMNYAFQSYTYYLRWWEMMVASSLTIGLRLSGISYKLQKNQLPDTREMWRMVDEKSKAALLGWNSAARSAPPAPLPLSPITASKMLRQQTQLLDTWFNVWKPFYSASTANAFRLSGTRKPSK